jgi:head-tail adaptor
MRPTAHLLTDTISVYRPGPTKDESGGRVSNFTLVHQDIPASVQEWDGEAIRTLGQRQVFMTHAVYLADSYQILRGDKIRTSDGRTLIVHGIANMGGRNMCWEIQCREET